MNFGPKVLQRYMIQYKRIFPRHLQPCDNSTKGEVVQCYKVLVVSQQCWSPLSIHNQIPFMLAWRGLVIPLVIKSVDHKYHMM